MKKNKKKSKKYKILYWAGQLFGFAIVDAVDTAEVLTIIEDSLSSAQFIRLQDYSAAVVGMKVEHIDGFKITEEMG